MKKLSKGAWVAIVVGILLILVISHQACPA